MGNEGTTETPQMDEQQFMVTLSGGRQFVRFPGFSDEYYFVIDDGGEDLKDKAMEAELREIATDEAGEIDLKRSKLVVTLAQDEFVQRCVVQVRDYKLLGQDERGNAVVMTYSKTNDGDNKTNRTVYRSLRDTKSVPFRSILLGAMDRVAGRETPFQAEFDALFAEAPRLLSDS